MTALEPKPEPKPQSRSFRMTVTIEVTPEQIAGQRPHLDLTDPFARNVAFRAIAETLHRTPFIVDTERGPVTVRFTGPITAVS